MLSRACLVDGLGDEFLTSACLAVDVDVVVGSIYGLYVVSAFLKTTPVANKFTLGRGWTQWDHLYRGSSHVSLPIVKHQTLCKPALCSSSERLMFSVFTGLVCRTR